MLQLCLTSYNSFYMASFCTTLSESAFMQIPLIALCVICSFFSCHVTGLGLQVMATSKPLPCQAASATLTAQSTLYNYRHASLERGLHQLNSSHLSCISPPCLRLSNDPAVAPLAILIPIWRLIKQRLHN